MAKTFKHSLYDMVFQTPHHPGRPPLDTLVCQCSSENVTLSSRHSAPRYCLTSSEFRGTVTFLDTDSVLLFVPIKTALLFCFVFLTTVSFCCHMLHLWSIKPPGSISPKPVDSILFLENLIFFFNQCAGIYIHPC